MVGKHPVERPGTLVPNLSKISVAMVVTSVVPTFDTQQ
jgi:hypothetical protein